VNIKCYADSFLHLKLVPIGTLLSRCRLHRRNTPGKQKLRKGKVRIRFADLQARVRRQGLGKVWPATLPEVQSTLGHGNIATTSGCLHARPDARAACGSMKG